MRLAAAGLYVPSRDLAHAGHELTEKILQSKVSREHDPLLALLLAAAAARHYPQFEPDLVMSLPPKPGEEDRFRNIRRELAAQLRADDADAALSRTRVTAEYRRMSAAQRLAAVENRHQASGSVRGKSVLLIDDVVTTGAQAADATRALLVAGAADVRIACVARTIDPQQRARIAPVTRRLNDDGARGAGLPVRSGRG